jgi:hypothetical protein
MLWIRFGRQEETKGETYGSDGSDEVEVLVPETRAREEVVGDGLGD